MDYEIEVADPVLMSLMEIYVNKVEPALEELRHEAWRIFQQRNPQTGQIGDSMPVEVTRLARDIMEHAGNVPSIVHGSRAVNLIKKEASE